MEKHIEPLKFVTSSHTGDQLKNGSKGLKIASVVNQINKLMQLMYLPRIHSMKVEIRIVSY